MARQRLRAALDDALRRRDRIAASALRSALSAIGNAEAVSPPPGCPVQAARTLPVPFPVSMPERRGGAL